MSNSKLIASVMVLIKGQAWSEAPNPIVVEALRYNLCMTMPTIARYLTNLGVPREQHPDELIVMISNGNHIEQTSVPNTLDPKTIPLSGATLPLAALETIARMHYDGETLPDGSDFDMTNDEAHESLVNTITMARQALGWKE